MLRVFHLNFKDRFIGIPILKLKSFDLSSETRSCIACIAFQNFSYILNGKFYSNEKVFATCLFSLIQFVFKLFYEANLPKLQQI